MGSALSEIRRKNIAVIGSALCHRRHRKRNGARAILHMLYCTTRLMVWGGIGAICHFFKSGGRLLWQTQQLR
nr:MAG TPA: hypothetical protein [Caudoviricetes sp.]